MHCIKFPNYRLTTLLSLSIFATQLLADEVTNVQHEREMSSANSRLIHDNTDLLCSYTNVAQMLEGCISSLDINAVSSTPGADPLLVIRGRRSLLDFYNTVAIYLNDVPFEGSLSEISPEDVESITVYKGTDAAAIFGVDGRNGVISIKTKSGKMHQKFGIRYKRYVGSRHVFSPYPVMSAKELREFRSTILRFDNTVLPYEDESKDIDWQREFFQTGLTNSHTFAIKGGGDKTTLYFSVGYLKDQGVIPTQNFTRYSNNIQLTHKFNENVVIGFKSVNNLTKTHNDSIADRVFLYATILRSPMFNEETANEYKLRDKDQLEELASDDNSYASRNMMFAYFNIPQMPDVKIKVVGGMDFIKDKFYKGSQYPDWVINKILKYRNTYFNPQIIYNSSFNDQHQLSASFQYVARSSRIKGSQPIYDRFPVNSDLLKRISEFANFSYCYDRRYSIHGVVRTDAMEDKLTYANSFSTTARWHVGEESWLANVPNIDLFDVRGSVGQVESPYSYYTLYGYKYGGTERYLSRTLGIDFSFFLDRIRGSFSMYNEKNRNILDFNLDNTFGISNRGFEFNLQTNIIRRYDLIWNAYLNLASNRNRIESTGKFSSALIGRPINSITDYKNLKQAYASGFEDAEEVHYSVDPKVYGGFSTDVTYRRLKFDVKSIFHIGGKLYNDVYNDSYMEFNYLKDDYELIQNSAGEYNVFKSRGIFDGGYLKIREMTLSYDIQFEELRRYGIKEFPVYFTIQNPFVLMSSYYRKTNMYPETNGTNPSLLYHNVFSVPSYPCVVADAPATRNFIFGFELHF